MTPHSKIVVVLQSITSRLKVIEGAEVEDVAESVDVDDSDGSTELAKLDELETPSVKVGSADSWLEDMDKSMEVEGIDISEDVVENTSEDIVDVSEDVVDDADPSVGDVVDTSAEDIEDSSEDVADASREGVGYIGGGCGYVHRGRRCI
jgi:hypothetical protein